MNFINLNFWKNSKIFIFILLITVSCSKKIDPITGEDQRIEVDPHKRAREIADKGGGIFGNINNTKSGAVAVDFATSNIMWRATLKSLEFLPLHKKIIQMNK
jgi:hypothetical protein